MKQIPFPVDVDGGRPVCTLDITERELTIRFGAGMDIHDSTLFPGPVRLWALMLDDGQVVAIEHHRHMQCTVVYANPRDLDRALRGLGIADQCVTWRYELEQPE